MVQVAYSPAAYPRRGLRADAIRPAADPGLADFEDAPVAGRRAAPPYPAAMRRARRRARLTVLATLAVAAAAGWAVLAGPQGEDPAPAGAAPPAIPAGPAPARSIPRPDIAWMLDPTPALGAGAAGLAEAAPPAPVFRIAAVPAAPAPVPPSLAQAPAPERASGALAYANPDAVAAPRPRLVPGPSAAPAAGVAVYDISAGTVTLPGGEVLEAHSGYGAMMDDPRYVHVRMRGPTPPGTYDLTERERPFHGVRAIRLTPVGGSGAIHGRDGILAHTYMLRQAGASNGCVVFREYPRFLGAFLRGEVRRMVVVAGGRGDFFGISRRVADR